LYSQNSTNINNILLAISNVSLKSESLQQKNKQIPKN